MKLVARGWDKKQVVPGGEGGELFWTWHVHNTLFNRTIILEHCIPAPVSQRSAKFSARPPSTQFVQLPTWTQVGLGNFGIKKEKVGRGVLIQPALDFRTETGLI